MTRAADKWGILEGLVTAWDNSAGAGKVLTTGYVLSDLSAPADNLGRAVRADDANALVLRGVVGGTQPTSVQLELEADADGDAGPTWLLVAVQSVASGTITANLTGDTVSVTNITVGTPFYVLIQPLAAFHVRVKAKRTGGSTDTTLLLQAARAHV